MAQQGQPALYYYVDHTSRFQFNSGIQRCVRSIAKALMAQGQPLVPVVWDRGERCFAPADAAAREHLAQWSGPDAQSWMPWHEWRTGSTTAPEWMLIVELVSGPHNPSAQDLQMAAKRLNVKLCWLFHDAIPLRWSHLYGSAGSAAAASHRQYMAALATFPLVVTNSKTSREHLLHFFAEEYGEATAATLASRIQAVPLADEGPEQPTSQPRAPEDPALGQPLKLLCVSTLEARKNHRGLLKALSWLHSQGWQAWQLHMVGWKADQNIHALIRRAIACGLPVNWSGRVNDQQLFEHYQACDATIYPSFEEGFGLPVAESLWHRRPCVCSGEGALGELASRGGCLTVDTRSWRSVATGIMALAEPNTRQSLTAAIKQRQVRRWSDVASDILNALKTCQP